MKTEAAAKNIQHNSDRDDRINWRYQDKAYNESFKQWRKQKQDSIGFYFVEQPNRHTYQDKVGFIKDYPEAHEAKAFQKVITILGFVLLYRGVFDIFATFFLPMILEWLGFHIHYSFFSGQRYGDNTLLITIDLITQLISLLCPIAVLIKHLEMPVSVMLPTKITNKPMFGFSIPAALLMAGSCWIMSFFYRQVLFYCHINGTQSLFIPEKTSDLIYLLVVQILIVPAVSEFCTHGVILQLTRQFGDGTALVITGLITAFLTYDITQIPVALVSSLVIGYFTIRTGSVITAVIMSSVQKLYIYAMYFITNIVDEVYRATLIKSSLFIALVIGISAAVHFLYNHSDRFGMTIKARYMSMGRKVLTAASCIPLIIWFTLTFVVTILNLDFTF